MLLLLLNIKKVTLNKIKYIGGSKYFKKWTRKIIKTAKNYEKFCLTKFVLHFMVVNTIQCCHVAIFLIVTSYKFIASKSKVSIPNRNGTKQQNLTPKL